MAICDNTLIDYVLEYIYPWFKGGDDALGEDGKTRIWNMAANRILFV
jgi:hypothetical protein